MSNTLLSVRKAKRNDILQLVPLAETLLAYHARLNPYFAPAKHIKKHYRKYFQRCIFSKNHRVVVVEVHNRIVGYAIGKLSKRPAIFKIQKIGSISEVFIKEAYRKQGGAKQLLGLLAKWFQEKGIAHVEMTVNAENMIGQKAWSACGFQAYNHVLLGKVRQLVAKHS